MLDRLCAQAGLLPARERIVAATPALRARQLLKHDRYATVIEAELAQRHGLAPERAALLGRVVLTCAVLAYERWCADPSAAAVGEQLERTLAEAAAVLAPFRARVGRVRPSGDPQLVAHSQLPGAGHRELGAERDAGRVAAVLGERAQRFGADALAGVLVDRRHRAAHGELRVAQLGPADLRPVHPVLDVRLRPAAHHDVRPEPCHRHRLVAASGDPFVQQVPRSPARDEHGRAVGVPGRARRLAVGDPVVLGGHPHEPALVPEHVREPLGDSAALVDTGVGRAEQLHRGGAGLSPRREPPAVPGPAPGGSAPHLPRRCRGGSSRAPGGAAGCGTPPRGSPRGRTGRG